MDRFLSYEHIKLEEDHWATAAACSMISLKLLRATEECLSYDHLRFHFYRVSESKIRVRIDVPIGVHNTICILLDYI